MCHNAVVIIPSTILAIPVITTVTITIITSITISTLIIGLSGSAELRMAMDYAVLLEYGEGGSLCDAGYTLRDYSRPCPVRPGVHGLKLGNTE